MTSPDKVFPTVDEATQTFCIRHGEIKLECTAANSGRITVFALADRNILTDATVNPFNFGSTFWTSPQKDWEWPPPKEIDGSGVWQGGIQGDTITLTGPVCTTLGVQIVKRLKADAAGNSILLEYEMRNTSSASLRYSHWEISRVHPGGITFYPMGLGAFPPALQSILPTQEKEGITWFHHTAQTVTGEHKLFADGKEGWIAHLDHDVLFIKSFEDTPSDMAAPTEAEIEIYAVESYVEVEQQGAYRTIEPKQTATWPVRWYLKRLPKTISRAVGSPSLVDFVRETIGSTHM